MSRIDRVRLILTLTVLVTLISITSGCGSNDHRLIEYARQATEQQARQNDRIAEQSRAVAQQSQELASAAHDLVQQDAQARRELILAHEKIRQQIQTERVSVDRQREELHAERTSVAAAAVREPLIAQAIFIVGLMLAALLPLLVTAYAIRRLPDTGGASELLMDDLVHEMLQARSLPDDLAEPRLPEAGALRLSGSSDSPGPSGEEMRR